VGAFSAGEAASLVPPLSGSFAAESLWPARRCGQGLAAERPNSVTDERPQPDPLALAMEWVAKITTVGLEMVLPAIGGAYLDKRFGTSYWALAGLVLGVVVGIWHLLQMTKPPGGKKSTSGGRST